MYTLSFYIISKQSIRIFGVFVVKHETSRPATKVVFLD